MTDPIVTLTGSWLSEPNVWSVLIKILLSLLFASMLGLERANKRHAAGLRTFIFVSLSGTFAALIDTYCMKELGAVLPLMSGVTVIGVAIISSNTLLFSSKSQIKGLTTAVALWTDVFIGLALGAGLYTLAVLGFLFMLIALDILPTLETYLKNRSNHFEIQLELKNRTDLQSFTATIRRLGLIIDDIESNPAYLNSGLSVYTILLTIHSKELKEYKTHGEIIEALKSLEYVNCIEEIK